MIDLKPKILDFIRKNGPSLPVRIGKEIERDSFLTSAILSELVSSKQLKRTHSKLGGSSLYYLQGQEYKLNMLYPHLNQREKEAYDLLKKNNILEDSKLRPVERVAISNIKDFAIPIDVKQDNNVKRFWKWHLISEGDAKEKIKAQIRENTKKIELPKEIIQKKQEQPKQENLGSYSKQEKTTKKSAKKKEKKDEFSELIDEYCKNNNMEILSKDIVKNNREINMTLKLPTQLGDLTFFVKARNKKKISNADLSLAYHEGRQLGLPVLFLTTGEPGKKSEEFIKKNFKNQLVFRRIN